MKIKLYIGIIVCAMCFMFASTNPAFTAGYAPGTCTIDKVGAADNYNFCFITCPKAGYNSQWFRLDDKNRKELLAVLLTAFSQNQEVEIYIQDDGHTIERIRMVK